MPGLRFVDRMTRKTDTLKDYFHIPRYNPPAYDGGPESHTNSEATTQNTQNSPVATPPPRYSKMNYITEDDGLAIPKNSLILVTGANSWQGMHIVDQLLYHGYRVRGTVRDNDTSVFSNRYFSSKYGLYRYTTAIVPDMAPRNAFNVAVLGCSGVIHVASVTTVSADPEEVITPSAAGAINALEAAAREGGVVRFVLTSSVAAVVSYDRTEPTEVDSESWNMKDFEVAWAPPPYRADRTMAIAASSKMQTEATAWRWYAKKRPNFVFNTVLPDTLWGKILDVEHQNHRSSVQILKSIYDGSDSSFLPSYFVDVQDSALLHIAALILPEVMSQRIYAVAMPWNANSVAQLMRGLYPHRDINVDVPDLGADKTVFKDAGKAKELLKKMGKDGWTDIITSIQRTCESFAE